MTDDDGPKGLLSTGDPDVLDATRPRELRRYRVTIRTHTGRHLQRHVVTFFGELKAVALACEAIHRQLGVNGRSVTAHTVSVEDLGRARHDPESAEGIAEGNLFDRYEF